MAFAESVTPRPNAKPLFFMTYQFIAHGDPKGQPRARAVAVAGRARMYDPGSADAWKSCVKLAADKAGMSGKMLDCPLHVALFLGFSYPASAYKGGKTSNPLKPNAPKYKTGKPDADNAAKAIMDALTDIGVWRDDAIIVHLEVTKVYTTTQPGCRVTITELV